MGDETTTLHAAVGPLQVQPFQLTVAEGPDAGASFAITPDLPGRMFIGKAESCTVRLTDPTVSRRHASVEMVDGALRVTDLGSTNGITVNGLRVFGAALTGGEQLRLGRTLVRVGRLDAVPAVPIPTATSFFTTVGASLAMRRLYPLCQRLAATDVPLVIEGETGTGKEQLAESLHRAGPRSARRLVVFDCTAVPAELIESELLGHERGAFTGAHRDREGVFEHADGGTLLIDEIGDLPLHLQSKLLRAIERREVTRVGSRTPVRVDVRILAATRRDLDREVQQGRFRDDLFHRLAVARIELPPLRERRGDIPLLAQHFARTLSKDESCAVPADILRRWEDYPWPGNLRELKNAVARWLALGNLAPDLPSAPGAPPAPGAPQGAPQVSTRDEIGAVLAEDLPLADARLKVTAFLERRYVTRLLDAHGGSVTRAAAAAGVARRHFHRLLAKVQGDEAAADDADD